MKKPVLIIVVLLLVFTGVQFGQLSFEVGFFSNYEWRGMDFYAKNTSAVQPSLTYTFKDPGFSINLFASYSLEDRDKHKANEELDITFTYEFSPSHGLNMSVGMINYGFYYTSPYSFKDGNTQEFFITAQFSKVFLAPSLSIYYDVNLGKGLYAELGASHTVKLSQKTGLALSVLLAYNSELFIEESGISHINFSASIPFKTGSLSITPVISYTHVFLESLYRENEKKNKFYAGVTFGIE